MRSEPKIQHSIRVIWTDAEKTLIVDHAITVRSEHPDVGGLALLRLAMQALPPVRRRKLIAVTQAPWFESALASESKRRTTEERARGDTAPIQQAISLAQSALLDLHSQWHAEQTQSQQAIIASVMLVHEELRKLNAKFGSPPAHPRISNGTNGRH